MLEHRIDGLIDGRGGLVIVTGAPGIGKTRLLAATRVWAERERQVLWLEGRTISYGEQVAYGPFVEVLRGLAEISSADDHDAGWQKLQRRVGELFTRDEAEEISPYLAMLLGIELPTPLAATVRNLEGEGAGLQIFRAMRRLCERLARRQPVVFAFEDWHWADETSAALLEHLLPLAGSVPALFCCSSRLEPSPVPSLRRRAAELGLDDCALNLELEPLAPAAADELMATLAERHPLPLDVRAQIVETTEGNPFFIEEIVRALLNDKQQEGQQLRIPDTLRGAIIARVDRLRGEAAEVLRVASVLGRSFRYDLLIGLVPETRVGAALDELAKHDFVREVKEGAERQLAFKHAVTQEVVYDNILLVERRELHRRIAHILEEKFSDRLDEFAGTVAFHYTQAQDWPRAESFLFRAGDHASSIAASAEALAYYGKALDACSRATGFKLDAEQRAALDRKIGEAFFRRGEHDQAAKYLRRALACLGLSYPATRGGVRVAIACAAAAQIVHRRMPLGRYRRINEEPDPWMEELSRILDTLGWIYFFSDPERVVLDSFRQLNVAERRGHRLAIVRASTGLGFTFDAIPMRRLAGNYHCRAVALSTQLENRRSIGIAHLGLAHHQRFQLAALDEALENYARAAEECQRAGDIRSRMGATLMLAEVTALRGDVGGSLGYGRMLMEVGEDAGDNQVLGWGHHAIGRTLCVAGMFAEAQWHLECGCELSERVPDYQALIVARGNLGLALIQRGELDAALEVLEATRRLARERRLRTFACTDMLKALAYAYLVLAERAEDSTRAEWMRSAAHTCRLLMRQEKLDYAAAPATRRLQGTYRWLRGNRRQANELWRRSLEAAAAFGLPHELASTQLEIARKVGDGSLEEAARRRLDELASRAAQLSTGQLHVDAVARGVTVATSPKAVDVSSERWRQPG